MKRTILFLLVSFCSSALAQTVIPAANSATSAARPTIAASFNGDVGYARIWVDGTEFSQYADRRGNTVTLVPPYNLDYGTHQVKVRTGSGQTAQWNFAIQREAYNAPNTGWNQGGFTEVLRYGPVPASVVTVTRPPIGAVFNGNVRKVRMMVDSVDVTGASRVQGSRVTWTPGYDLDQGQHRCVVTATAPNGQAVRGEWNFVIRSW